MKKTFKVVHYLKDGTVAYFVTNVATKEEARKKAKEQGFNIIRIEEV